MTLTDPNHPTAKTLEEAANTIRNQKVDAFEIYYVNKKGTNIDAKDGEIDSLQSSEDEAVSIRVLQSNKEGFSFTTRLDLEAIRTTAKTAVEIAKHMPEDPHHRLCDFNQQNYGQPPTQIDANGLAIPLAEKIALARELESRCLKADARIQGVRSASFRDRSYTVAMMDTNGKIIKEESSLFSLSLMCRSEENGDHQIGYDSLASHLFSKMDVDLVAKRGAENATELLGAGKPRTMKCPALLRNNVVSELLDFLSSSFSAEEMEKGRSLLKGRLGETIFSESVTLIDDGRLEDGYASGWFDAEGVPTQKHALVQDGVFKKAFYNCYYGKKLGAQPSGTSVRGMKGPPSIGFSNLFFEPGQSTLEQMCSDITEGVMITDLMGIHTANPVTGDFSLGASGILIENGKITRPVKGFAVAGNILELFRKMTHIGQDFRFFGSVGAPSVRVESLSIGGTS